MKKIILLLATIACCSKTIYAQWEPTTGFQTGFVNIKASGANLIAESQLYNCYFSTNNGASWTFINSFTDSHPRAIASNGNDIYIGTDNGLFYSNDDGVNWVKLTTNKVYSVATKGNALIIGIFNAVLLSNDRGITWTTVGNVRIAPTFLTFRDTAILAGSSEGLFLSTSTNAQAQWVAMNNNLFSQGINSVAVIGTKIFVTTPFKVYLSTDNGNSWVEKRLSGNGRTLTLAASGTNIWVLTDNNELFYSENDGTVWKTVNHLFPRTYSLSTNGARIVVGTLNGAYESTDNGVNWQTINKGLQIDLITSMQSDGVNIYAKTAEDSLYISTDNGLNWSSKNLSVQTILADSTNTTVYAGNYYGLLKSTNNGQNFNPSALSIPIYGLLRQGNTLYAGSPDRLSRSLDNGVNWTRLGSCAVNRYGSLSVIGDTIFSAEGNSGSLCASKNGSTITSYYVSGSFNITSQASNKGILYVGVQNGAYTSKNRGVSFERFGDYDIRTVLFRDSNVLIPCLGLGVNVAINNSPNWRSLNKNLPTLRVYSLVVHKNYILAGTNVGVFRGLLTDVMRFDNPPNDTCQNAITLPPSVTIDGTTATATAETEPNRLLACQTFQNVKDVWYKFRSDTGTSRPFRMQLTLTRKARSPYFKYLVYAGSCSDYTVISACTQVGVNNNSTVVDTIVLTAANQDYYIRIWSESAVEGATFSIKIEPVQNFNAVPIAQATTVTSCRSFANLNINTVNSQKWNTLMDGNSIVAEINPNGNLLGQVTGGYFINSTGTIRRASGTPYLDRNIGIKVTNQPTTNVSVRLYFTERERAAYFAIVGANPLAVTHYAGALCLATVQTGSGELLPASIRNTPSGDYYVEFNTTRFSGFFLGPNRSLVFSQEVNADPTKLMIQEVYPMPISTELGVVFTAYQATAKGRIFVTDILGKTVLSSAISIESGRNELKLNTSAFATGLYILHISDGVYETAKKIVKQ